MWVCTAWMVGALTALLAWVRALEISAGRLTAAKAAPAIRTDVLARAAIENAFMVASKRMGRTVNPCARSGYIETQRTDARLARSLSASGPVVGVAFMSLSGPITEPLKLMP